MRAGLKSPLLASLGTDCDAIVHAGQCEADLNDVFPGSLPAGSIAMDVACPVSCGKCPRWDGVHRPPKATDLQAPEWSCSQPTHPLPPLPDAQWTGQRFSLEFTCPETDGRIGGAAENAAAWRHAEFARQQREWLDQELGGSDADWKIVVGLQPPSPGLALLAFALRPLLSDTLFVHRSLPGLQHC